MSETCPNCGYCKHCGRGGYITAPWVSPRYPIYPTYLPPPWTYPTWTTADIPMGGSGTTFTVSS